MTPSNASTAAPSAVRPRYGIARWLVVAVLPILTLLLSRMDLWSVALTTIAVACWQRGRAATAGGALAAATALKLWPLPVAILLIANHDDRRRVAPVLVFAGLTTAVAVGWWALAGWSGLWQVLTFRSASGWQIESLVGSVLHLVDSSPVRQESGAWRIGVGSTSGVTSILLFVFAAPLCLWGFLRGRRADRLGAGWLVGVSALLLSSALLSPQFMGWLLPGAAIAWAQNDRRPAALAVLAVSLTATYRWHMWAIMVVVRNVVLLAMALSAAAGLRSIRKKPATEAEMTAGGSTRPDPSRGRQLFDGGPGPPTSRSCVREQSTVKPRGT